jgi:hypothetical protein
MELEIKMKIHEAWQVRNFERQKWVEGNLKLQRSTMRMRGWNSTIVSNAMSEFEWERAKKTILNPNSDCLESRLSKVRPLRLRNKINTELEAAIKGRNQRHLSNITDLSFLKYFMTLIKNRSRLRRPAFDVGPLFLWPPSTSGSNTDQVTRPIFRNWAFKFGANSIVWDGIWGCLSALIAVLHGLNAVWNQWNKRSRHTRLSIVWKLIWLDPPWANRCDFNRVETRV